MTDRVHFCLDGEHLVRKNGELHLKDGEFSIGETYSLSDDDESEPQYIEGETYDMSHTAGDLSFNSDDADDHDADGSEGYEVGQTYDLSSTA